jgi:TonB family protein
MTKAIPLPKMDKPEAPPSVVPAVPHIDVAQPAVTAPSRPAVQTGAFSKADASRVTTSAPPRDVQTGGFGDPNGVPARTSDRLANIASLGAFDLPAASGAGNGTGGSRGTRGVVAGAGFGSADASTGTAAGRGSRGVVAGAGFGGPAASTSAAPITDRNVKQSGFEQQAQAAPSPGPKKIDAGPPDKPVEITFKPRPDYTEDARKLRLEGEVLVHVLFKATGEISVLDLVRGLGHGLDDNAIRAAQQIRFKPAMRAGQPVDSTATVHIIFQLAF